MAKRINYRDRVEDGELDLSMSDLQEVPVRDIVGVKKATSLDLSNNRLTSIGKNFTSLNFLVKLNLSKNQISRLPENFGDLQQLKHLDLYSNQLIHLPVSFGNLLNLKWLDLSSNPLVPALAAIAGPCSNSAQCQECAKRVVQALADTLKRVEEEKQRIEKEQKEREMAEKAAAKKEQQKNKKTNKNEKKKNVENGVRPQQDQQPKQQQKKKEKSKLAKAAAKPSGSLIGRLFKTVFKFGLLASIALTLLYWLDVDRFRQVQAGACRAVDAAVALLPPQTFVYLNETSTFLNTDPRVKAHWANIRDISGLLRARVVEAVSTFVAVVPVYINDVKRLVFDKNNTAT